MEWNQHAFALTLLPAFALAPVQQARVMAIVQVAVHDAVNGITGNYETYLSPGPAPENASPEAAAIAAAHYALKNLFPLSPTQAASLEASYADSLAAHGLSPLDAGIAYGESAAAAILALRANDFSAQAQFNYSAPGAGTAGIWVPLTSAPALLPGWGNVSPWVLRSGSQFRPEAPAALDSEQYAKDYNEIKEIGKLNSSTRTQLQTQIATFWRASPTAIWNPVIRQVVAARNPDLSTTARTFALVYLAVADASIACWDAKYFYNYWRPEPAIRNGDFDGNDLTAGDATWTPLVRRLHILNTRPDIRQTVTPWPRFSSCCSATIRACRSWSQFLVSHASGTHSGKASKKLSMRGYIRESTSARPTKLVPDWGGRSHASLQLTRCGPVRKTGLDVPRSGGPYREELQHDGGCGGSTTPSSCRRKNPGRISLVTNADVAQRKKTRSVRWRDRTVA